MRVGQLRPPPLSGLEATPPDRGEQAGGGDAPGHRGGHRVARDLGRLLRGVPVAAHVAGDHVGHPHLEPVAAPGGAGGRGAPLARRERVRGLGQPSGVEQGHAAVEVRAQLDPEVARRAGQRARLRQQLAGAVGAALEPVADGHRDQRVGLRAHGVVLPAGDLVGDLQRLVPRAPPPRRCGRAGTAPWPGPRAPRPGRPTAPRPRAARASAPTPPAPPARDLRGRAAAARSGGRWRS